MYANIRKRRRMKPVAEPRATGFGSETNQGGGEGMAVQKGLCVGVQILAVVLFSLLTRQSRTVATPT